MDSFRKAYGALKDSTKVGLARVNSEFKELDIAIVKATNHNECPPKERHVRKIFQAVSITSPRADVNYCIHALSKRLAKTSCWIVAMKTLIVYHRMLREADPSFREELIRFTSRGQIFQVATFKDDAGALAFDCSACVRSYAFFLEERLECYRNFNFDIEIERGPKSSAPRHIDSTECQTRGDSPPKEPEELLSQLPALQQLIYRLISYQPEGLARQNFVIQYALALVVKDSFKIYCAINDRIINLVDMYFDMPKDEAVKALNIYKKAGRQADHLAVFYEFCKTLDLAQTFHFPTLTQPPPSFLSTMEDYVKEAPETRVSRPRQEEQDSDEEQEKPEEPAEEESEEQDKEEIVELNEEPASTTEEVQPPVNLIEEPVDFLGLNELQPQAASSLEDSNALALAIIQPGDNPPPATNPLDDIGRISGWELALVETPSNMNKPIVAETKLAGGFDKSLLDSLYEDDVSRKQLQLHSAGYNTGFGSELATQTPFDPHNPFAMSNSLAAPNNMQMVPVIPHQQQQQMMMMQQQQQNMMMMMMATPNYPYSAQYSQQQMPMASNNPFGDPFTFPQNTMPPNGQHTLF